MKIFDSNNRDAALKDKRKCMPYELSGNEINDSIKAAVEAERKRIQVYGESDEVADALHITDKLSIAIDRHPDYIDSHGKPQYTYELLMCMGDMCYYRNEIYDFEFNCNFGREMDTCLWKPDNGDVRSIIERDSDVDRVLRIDI